MTADFLNRGKEYISMLESSKYMCERNGLDAHALKLPDVTEEDTERCKKHVTGHIRLMRKSTPEYYQAVAETLSANKAVLLYLYDNFDIFGRYGNKQLKDELSQKNIKLGGNLGENFAGTNAAVMAARSPKSCLSFPADDNYKNHKTYRLQRSPSSCYRPVSLYRWCCPCCTHCAA